MVPTLHHMSPNICAAYKWIDCLTPSKGKSYLPHMVAKGLSDGWIKCAIILLLKARFSCCNFFSGFNALDHYPASLLTQTMHIDWAQLLFVRIMDLLV